MAENFKPSKSLALPESRVHQHARRRRFNQRQIAAAARRQNGYSDADRALPKAKIDVEMMAGREAGVNPYDPSCRNVYSLQREDRVNRCLPSYLFRKEL